MKRIIFALLTLTLLKTLFAQDVDCTKVPDHPSCKVKQTSTTDDTTSSPSLDDMPIDDSTVDMPTDGTTLDDDSTDSSIESF